MADQDLPSSKPDFNGAAPVTIAGTNCSLNYEQGIAVSRSRMSGVQGTIYVP